jgi:DNA mismatch repair protein MSH4
MQGRPRSSQSRPATSLLSRPNTARPQTAISTKQDASYVVAVVEGRGISREVGIAALDKGTGAVMLAQLSDCQTYVKTLHQLYLHPPCLLLVPDTFVSAETGHSLPGSNVSSNATIVGYLHDEFPSVPMEVVSRRYWNSEGGMVFVNELSVNDDERAGTILTLSTK